MIGANTSRARPPGRGEVYRDHRRAAPASATSLRLYLDGSSRASKLVLGLYADTGGEAGALLGAGSLDRTGGGRLEHRRACAAASPLTAGTPYWIALLNPADSTGTLAWRDRAGGSGGARAHQRRARR